MGVGLDSTKALRPFIFKLLADIEFHQCHLNEVNEIDSVFCQGIELSFKLWLQKPWFTGLLKNLPWFSVRQIRFVAPRFFVAMFYYDLPTKIRASRTNEGWQYFAIHGESVNSQTKPQTKAQIVTWREIFN